MSFSAAAILEIVEESSLPVGRSLVLVVLVDCPLLVYNPSISSFVLMSEISVSGQLTFVRIL